MAGRSEADERSVAKLYGRVMEAARAPGWFEAYGLRDEMESRFELLALHQFLALERLQAAGAPGRALAQQLVDYMVGDLDRSLREAGVGDTGVAKRMKRFMEAFYGRARAYREALASADEKEILRALDRNLFGGVDTNLPVLAAVRDHIRRQRQLLAGQGDAELLQGELHFTPPLASHAA